MRVTGATLLVVLTAAALLPAREPTKQELLVAIEKQLKAAGETAGPAVACVVVSRSEHYPKVPGADQPGKLGGYDVREFLKLNPAPGDARLGVSLDLSNPDNLPDHGTASGVVIDPAGLVLTPYHIVEGATKVYVHLPGRAGSYADIHAADARHDLAVLKLITPPPGLSAIKFTDVSLRARNGQPANVFTGKLVIALGHAPAPPVPLGVPSASLESVSGTHVPSMEKDKPQTYYKFGPLLEFGPIFRRDAKPNNGADGAALLNLDGELVGLTTSAAAATGAESAVKYAFPADENFRRVVEVLRRGEEVEYGFLGVSLFAGQAGNGAELPALLITSVVPHGPADLAGIRGGTDLVTHVNDIPISTYEELLLHVGSALAGNKVKMTVVRGGRRRDAEVTLGKFQHGQPFIASVGPEPVFGLRVEYSSVLAQRLTKVGDGVSEGVCVRDLFPNSPAAAAFKKLDDRPDRWLITHVNGTPVATPAEFYKAAKGPESIKLTVKDPAEPLGRDREVTLP